MEPHESVAPGLVAQPIPDHQRGTVDDHIAELVADESTAWRLQDRELEPPANHAEQLERAEGLLVQWMLRLWDREHKIAVSNNDIS